MASSVWQCCCSWSSSGSGSRSSSVSHRWPGRFHRCCCSPESDIALAFGLTVDRPPLPVITSNSLSLVLVLAGMAIAELVRFRYQLRVAGIIVVPLVVLITFRNGMLLPVWMLATVGAYGSIQLVHWWTLLYGRVLLAFGIIVSILTTVSLVSVVPVIHGVLPFFVGLLGGVTAYNIHVVPPESDRQLSQ